MNTLRGPVACVLAAAALLVACDEAPSDADPDYLRMNPERLAQLRVQCRMDPALHREAVCRAVAEATRRRFMGEGTPYTPSRPLPDPSDGGAAP
jgi:Conjugative transfer region protein TrbK